MQKSFFTIRVEIKSEGQKNNLMSGPFYYVQYTGCICQSRDASAFILTMTSLLEICELLYKESIDPCVDHLGQVRQL